MKGSYKESPDERKRKRWLSSKQKKKGENFSEKKKKRKGLFSKHSVNGGKRKKQKSPSFSNTRVWKKFLLSRKGESTTTERGGLLLKRTAPSKGKGGGKRMHCKGGESFEGGGKGAQGEVASTPEAH